MVLGFCPRTRETQERDRERERELHIGGQRTCCDSSEENLFVSTKLADAMRMRSEGVASRRGEQR